jgi:CO dehydrogenase maturation factor
VKRVIVCGKGGAGKTTLTSLIITQLSAEKPDARILVIDADPAANLAISLGTLTTPELSIGELDELVLEDNTESSRSILTQFFDKCVIPLEQIAKNVEYAYLGHHQKNSCLCSYNNALNDILKSLNQEKTYDYIILDREAGLEHINRSVYGNKEDVLILVSWPSEEYLGVVKDILELADMLGSTKNRMLVLNNVHGVEVSDEEIAGALVSEDIAVAEVVVMPRLPVQNGFKKRNSGEVLAIVDTKTRSAVTSITKFIG